MSGWFSLFIFLFSTSLLAQDPRAFENEFKTLATDRVALALANGWTEVQGLSIRQISYDIQTPRVFMNHPRVIYQVGDRAMAVWDRQARVVQVNNQVWNESPLHLRQGLALHELLGSTGYNDSNYQISLRLEMMASRRPRADEPQMWLVAGGGGATGIAGGGDEINYNLKRFVYFYLTRQFSERARNQAQRRLAGWMEQALLEVEIEVLRRNLANEPFTMQSNLESGRVLWKQRSR